MSRQLEWVPWDLGTPSLGLSVGPNQTLQIAALNPGSWQATEVVGRIEPFNRYFVHRIVGQIIIDNNNDEETISAVNCTIGPGRYEVEGADTIFTKYGVSGQGSVVTGTNWTGSLGNNEFWWYRRFGAMPPLSTIGGNPIEIPWWTCPDFKPKRVMETLETPVLMINNEDVASTLFFSFVMRMLVTPL